MVLVLCVSKLFLPPAKWRVAKRAIQCGLKILILSANSDSLRLEVKDKYSFQLLINRVGQIECTCWLAPSELNSFLLDLDHNNPSKPSHRMTNGPEPSKTIESDGSNIKKPS